MLLTESLLGSSSAAPVYIEDVFSTYLYTGNSSTQTITNGIDLSGKGGLVWTKTRGSAISHALYDTVRGNFFLSSDTASPQSVPSISGMSFGSSGYNLLGADGNLNNSSFNPYASWSFRKQAKFFDIVTYTGNGVSGRTISHNLGSAPGCIIIKCTSVGYGWVVGHRGSGWGNSAALNSTDSFGPNSTTFANTAPTSTVFTVGDAVGVNQNTQTYVAYLFAHDAGGFGATGTDNVISCGSFTGTSKITLGYEPQFVLMKQSSAAGSWYLYDTMRGIVADPTVNSEPYLLANLSNAEGTGQNFIGIDATGFTPSSAAVGPSDTYIYIAIRRGPMKTPTTGSTVYGAVNRTATGAAATVNAGRVVDLSISARNTTSNGNANIVFDRMRGANNYILTTQTSAESTGGVTDLLTSFANQTGVALGADTTYGYINSGGMGSVINWYFTRAPGVFDIVAYTGTGANRTVSHNLGVAPEFMIVKGRSGTTAWQVYSSALANTEYLVLNTTAAKATGATRWNSTTPTSSVFSLGTATEVNTSSATYIAYLFASCPGVSKVGSYTGTGAVQTIDCGFTAGARFLLIKRTDSTSDWYLWDSTRGIQVGNDPYLRLNLRDAPVTTTDWVNPASSGFALSNAVGNLVNTSSATYTFLAIA